MMNKIIIFLLSSFFIVQLQAQAPEIEWQKSYGGSKADWGKAIQQTTDGGYIVAGYGNSDDGDVTGHIRSLDFWIVKLNDVGNIEWQKSLGGSSMDILRAIQQTFDGGYIIAGSSYSNDEDVSGNHGHFDYWIVKLNNSGNIEWQKSLGGSDADEAYDIKQTTDGGYIVAGASFSSDGDLNENFGSSDYWIVKLNNLGNIEWQKSLGGSDSDAARSIQQTVDGGFVVAGYSYSNDGDVSGNHGGIDFWVVKIDELGSIEWQRALGGTDSDSPRSIQQTVDGGFVVAGYSYSNDGDVSENKGGGDYWIVKLDELGNTQWQKAYGGSKDDWGNAIQQTLDGGYIVVGESQSNDGDITDNRGDFDYWIVKLNNSGNKEWQKSLGGSGPEHADAIHQTLDGGYIMVGISGSNDGDVSGNHGNYDYWVVKLGPDKLVVSEVDAVTFAIYPNPVKDILTIENLFPKTELVITNLNGEIIYKTTAKNTIETINVSHFSAGVYFINGQKWIKK
ncbi:MAG TPA: T9SS type A sorting domain-containing protein [Moheibacter sp.]|nr:T9SS type A sorting domain-containing protein [Moheibacter sp.]